MHTPPLDGARVTVMGLGRFGGGQGVTRWLCSQGARVLLTDIDSEESLRGPLTPLRPLAESGQITLRLGGHDAGDFTACDLVVANPAVPRPWENPFLCAARSAGVPVTAEISLLTERLPEGARTVAITGSVGKSTTTAMVQAGLSAAAGAHRVFMGGNIGGSLLERLDCMPADACVALELSSAMLYWLHETTRFAPDVAVLTSFSANHVDWHASLEHYRESKARIFEHQRAGQAAVLGPRLEGWASCIRPGVRVAHAGGADFSGELAAPGAHNRANAGVALAACRAALPGADAGVVARGIGCFAGLAHRLEFVGEFGGVRYYNDSKSTTPESLMTAMSAVAPGDAGAPARSRVHLIAGGYDKKTDLTRVARLAQDIAGLYTIGQTGPALAQAAGEVGAKATPCGTLERAMVEVRGRVRPGDLVLLSPACASWDQFVNYEQRGDLFRTLAKGNA